MPILVKDYSWAETEGTIRISVPLKGVSSNKADIFTTDDYLKVSYPPYLFEVCLFDAVEDSKGKATVGNGVIVFSLEKQEQKLWGQLPSPESENKEFMRKKREEALEVAHKRVEEQKKRRAEEQRAQEKYTLRQQMELEEKERKRIEAEKEEERRRATEAIERWKERQCEAQLPASHGDGDSDQGDSEEDTADSEAVNRVSFHKQLSSDADSEQGDSEEDTAESEAVNRVSFHKQLSSDADNEHGSDSEEDIAALVPEPQIINKVAVHKQDNRQRKITKKKVPKKELLEKAVPDPRAGGTIQVSFTPRPFRTAARESKAPEEEEWLKKVAKGNQAKTTAAHNPDAVDMEEMNPLWLKDKGIGFYKAQNYVAAINAFTAAIVLDSSIPPLYSNRAACHLHMKQYKECVQDCTSALELLTPAVPANASSRCKAHVRRGTAYFQVEGYVEALKDYECALKLDPHNTNLQTDADRIRKIIQGTI